MYMNNQKWRLLILKYIYIYICVCVYTYHMCIYMDIYSENVKFLIVNLRLDVKEKYFYHNFLQIDYDKFYIFRIYMYTHTHIYIFIHIYMFCSHFSSISQFYHCMLFRYFIVIQKIHSK